MDHISLLVCLKSIFDEQHQIETKNMGTATADTSAEN